MEVQQVKQRFGIIGNAPLLNRALEVAIQVAPTDISVLVTGESGTGKEIIPQVIHQLSARKHGEYIAVNCGAIPEGTIDSELFGHEKGSFTGASGSRKGYFEVADGGTIFLDEVAELPMQTQVRLLRVLETGEFIRVGSSKSIKTNVRVVAATNENMQRAISSGKFREDLFYRLSTVPISLPSLRNRKEDVHLLFRKFASDFSDKYRMPAIKLNEDAVELLNNYSWPGNIRQLKNLVEQISVIETSREIDAVLFKRYLPDEKSNAPAIIPEGGGSESINERELMYKFLFDMKKDLTDLKKIVLEMVSQNGEIDLDHDQTSMINRFYSDVQTPSNTTKILPPAKPNDETDFDFDSKNNDSSYEEHEEVEESLSLEDREKELIQKALEKHKGKRKYAASELGISERTLYRKIKEYNLAD
jgi:transcriptional regulator with PAS, ATPase and Fis domain